MNKNESHGLKELLASQIGLLAGSLRTLVRTINYKDSIDGGTLILMKTLIKQSRSTIDQMERQLLRLERIIAINEEY